MVVFEVAVFADDRDDFTDSGTGELDSVGAELCIAVVCEGEAPWGDV